MQRTEFYRKAFANLGVVGTVMRQLSRRSSSPMITLRSKHSRYPIRARRQSSDMMVFDQIFVGREYRCLDGLARVRTIVDAGANVGYSSAYLLSRYSDASVVAIEPDPGNFALLTENMRPFGERARLLRGALWSENTTLDLSGSYEGEGKEWSRRVEPATAGMGAVEALSIPGVLKRFGLETIDLLKIDIEGAETAVFSAADLSWLDRVGNIVIELHDEACIAAFHAAIEGRGYVVSQCDELTVALRPAD